jgi:phosphoribosylaminoimidazole (AIR) synthetase
MEQPTSYKDAGVNIDKANESVNMMKKWVERTHRRKFWPE